MTQEGNVWGGVTLLSGTGFRPVRFNKRQQNEEAWCWPKDTWALGTRLLSSRNIHGVHMFPQCFPRKQEIYRKHCFQCKFLFSRCKLCLRYTAENLNENPSMRALVKILRARESEHLPIFCEQFEQWPNFASTFKLDRTIRYPLYDLFQVWHTNESKNLLQISPNNDK